VEAGAELGDHEGRVQPLRILLPLINPPSMPVFTLLSRLGIGKRLSILEAHLEVHLAAVEVIVEDVVPWLNLRVVAVGAL